MANPSNSWFPLLESDQAEVIEIFNELMRQGRGASNSTETLPHEPVGPPNDLRELGLQWGIPGLD